MNMSVFNIFFIRGEMMCDDGILCVIYGLLHESKQKANNIK